MNERRADPDAPTTYATSVGSVRNTKRDDPEPDEPVADEEHEEHGDQEPRRVSPVLVLGRVLLGLVSAVALAAMTIVWFRVDALEDSKNTTDALDKAQAGAPADDDGANDILIVGNDSRTDQQGHPLSAELLKELRTEATSTLNTDTLILLRIPDNGTGGFAISIPRDTSVMVPNLGREEKINGAFGITKEKTAEQLRAAGGKDRATIERESDDAGRASLIQSVQGLTGVRIDHYTEVSLYGFYLLTEAIDGVDVCLNQATSDPDSGASFAKGPQTVRGGDAVSFVRQRKGLPRGDLDRIVRQQTFLSSAMNKVLSGGILTDNTRLAALEDAVSKSVVMDDGLHFLQLVEQAQALASGQMRFVTIPVTGVGARNDRGQSIITVDVPSVHAWVKSLASGTAPPAQTPQQAPPSNLTGDGPLDLTSPSAATTQVAAVPCVD
jgi:LCP family protein required for cell wall assembly